MASFFLLLCTFSHIHNFHTINMKMFLDVKTDKQIYL